MGPSLDIEKTHSHSQTLGNHDPASEPLKVLDAWPLQNGYELRLVHRYLEPDFTDLFKKHFQDMFPMTDASQLVSSQEKEAEKTLKSHFKDRFSIRLGVYKNEKVIAWSLGWQTDHTNFYMANSCVLPEYRKQGLYSTLVKKLIQIVTEK